MTRKQNDKAIETQKSQKLSIPFVKMHGAGNDYVYLDCFEPETAALVARIDLPELARRISDRHRGVGSDGMVLIMPSNGADARMRIFNADGSEAEMCGNAIRCVGKYLYESGKCSKRLVFIETLAGIRSLTLQLKDGEVKAVTVNMGVPRVQSDTLMRGSDPIGFCSVNMGNPHAVFFRENTTQIEEISHYGPLIGAHAHFPEGTNVEFACVRNLREIDVRVWERGSGLTLACGTGACATAVAAIWNGWTDKAVTVHLLGGDLEICWEGNPSSVFMTGPATEVFRGVYYWEE